MEVEKRLIKSEFRVQDLNGTNEVEGHAAIYNSGSEDLGGFREMLMPDAFKDADVSDVRVLKNHNADYILGRTTAGTADVTPVEDGLHYRYTDGGTSYGKDLIISMKRGDITQSSFAFRIAEGGDKWEKASDGVYERRINKIAKVFDVSPVTYPAYPDTTVAKRSIESIETREADELRLAKEREDAERQAEADQREAEIRLKEIQG